MYAVYWCVSTDGKSAMVPVAARYLDSLEQSADRRRNARPFDTCCKRPVSTQAARRRDADMQLTSMSQHLVLYALRQTHTPLTQKLPGLRKYKTHNGPVQALSGTSGCNRMD